MANYPTGVSSFSTKNYGDTVQGAHINDLQAEVTAIENALINGLAHNVSLTGTLAVTGNTTVNGTFAVTGNATVSGTLGVSGATTTNGQVIFPATQNPSAGANTLDDYEEGTWTPIDSSGAGLTFSGVTGQYVKVGQMVYVTGTVTYPATADGSVAIIGGLPFTSTTLPQLIACRCTNGSNPVHASVTQGTTTFVPVTTTGTLANSALTTATVTFSGYYRATA